MKKTVWVALAAVVCANISLSVANASSIEDTRKAIFEGVGTCDQAVFTNDQYLAVSLLPFVPNVGHVRVYSLKDPSHVTDISTHSRVTDIKIEGDTAYVLTGWTIEGWSISSGKQLFQYASHPQASPGLNLRERAQGFVLSGKRAVIAHGVLGVTVIDLESGKTIKTLPMPTVSAAQDIALVNADKAVLAIDNNDERQFRGMYLMNLRTLGFTKQIKIDNALPSAVRVLDNDRLMLVYYNAIWKFGKTQALAATKEPRPSRRAWQFPGLNVVDMQGKVAFDQKNLYACFKTWDSQTDERDYKPMAFDLKALQLD
ncbi:MAG: hypothetical protein ACJ763_02120 [Bdellovibrionia bacterium]